MKKILITLSIIFTISSPCHAMRQVIISGLRNNLNNSTTEYVGLATANPRNWTATRTNVEQLISAGGTLSRLLVETDAAPGAGDSYVFTVYVNGSASSLTATVSETGAQGFDFDNEVSISPGDLVVMEVAPTGTPATTFCRWALVFQSTNDREYATIAGSNVTIIAGKAAADVNYLDRGATWLLTTGAGVFDREALFSQNVTLKDLYLELTVAPGAGENYTFTVGGSSISVPITDTSTTGNDTSNTKSILATDNNHFISYTSSLGAATSRARWGFVFETEIEDEYPIAAGSNNNLNATFTEYNSIDGTGRAWNGTLTSRESLMQCSRVKNFYVELSKRPGGAVDDTFQFTIMKNGVATDLDFTITHPATTGSDTSNIVEFDDFDTITIRSTPGGTPVSTVDASWGITVEATTPHNLSTTGAGV